MSEITIIIRGKKIRMKEENKLVLSQIVSNNPFAKITGKKDGKVFFMELTSAGTKWIEAN